VASLDPVAVSLVNADFHLPRVVRGVRAIMRMLAPAAEEILSLPLVTTTVRTRGARTAAAAASYSSMVHAEGRRV